jgi:hypothetical protein
MRVTVKDSDSDASGDDDSDGDNRFDFDTIAQGMRAGMAHGFAAMLKQ